MVQFSEIAVNNYLASIANSQVEIQNFASVSITGSITTTTDKTVIVAKVEAKWTIC